MPQRLGRRSAGEQVVARAGRLSDDLLTLEENCFAAIDLLFEESVDHAADVFVRAWRRAKEDPKALTLDRTWQAAVGEIHAGVLAASRPPVAGLAAEVRHLSLESIGEEQTRCEETLAKRYVGIAVEAVKVATDRSDEVVSSRLEQYERALEAGQEAFQRQVNQQVLLSAQKAEDQTRVAKRLFNPEPNTLVGNGGRGVWWRASSGLKAAARDVSIRLSSEVRLAAMEEFNAAGDAR